MATAADELLRRLDGFAKDLDRTTATRVEQIEGGAAILTPDLPLVWSANYLLFETAAIGAARMAELSEEVLGGLGMEHRAVSVLDPAEGRGLAAEFRELGWESDSDLFMVLRGRPPDRPVPAGVSITRGPMPVELNLAIAMDNEDLGDPSTPRGEIAEQLVEWRRRQGRTGGDDWLMAALDGEEPASTCRLLKGEGPIQVEDVATLISRQNRGLAQAVIVAAGEAARELGGDPVFLVADAEDWPLKLYERLGFESIGGLLSFIRAPSSA